MSINAEGIALIKEFETFRSKAYLCPAGVWTIGWGMTKGVKPGDTITRPQADKDLAADIAVRADAVLRNCTRTPSDNEMAAMVSLAFNIGLAAFKGSTVLRAHNRDDKQAAARAFALWNKAKGKVLAGLTRRRAAEAALYLKPDEGVLPMPQAVDAESQPARGPIVTGTTLTATAGVMATVGQMGDSVADIRYGLGEWFAPVLLVVIVAAAVWVVASRFTQRKKGWA